LSRAPDISQAVFRNKLKTYLFGHYVTDSAHLRHHFTLLRCDLRTVLRYIGLNIIIMIIMLWLANVCGFEFIKTCSLWRPRSNRHKLETSFIIDEQGRRLARCLTLSLATTSAAIQNNDRFGCNVSAWALWVTYCWWHFMLIVLLM